MKMIGVIPARLKSTRLAQKVLREIKGKPMIQHVWEKVKQASKIEDVIIACDDEAIGVCAEQFGAKVMMTSPDHPNGTSRVAEVAQKVEGDVFLNIQGDEPFIDPAAIDRLADVFVHEKNTQVATLAVSLEDEKVYHDPNAVKVVCDGNSDALYFSRAAIPCFREKDQKISFLKHLGIYGYRKDFLIDFVTWNASDLEQKEKLEQLRILERGIKIRVLRTSHDSLGIDTEEDLKAAEEFLN